MSRPIAIAAAELGWRVPWEEVQKYPWVQAWKTCPQDPIYHAEGNVWVHTRMVLNELVADPAWRALPAHDAEIAYLAALLHDVAKPSTTRVQENGRVSARGHSPRGAIDARRILWEMGYPFALREAVCALVRFHQVPYFLVDEPNPEPNLARISQSARCDLLQLVSGADIRGRIYEGAARSLENIEKFGALARQQRCVNEPVRFDSDHARFRYFRGGARVVDSNSDGGDTDFQPAGSDTDFRCEVILMSGLPGAGKDRWIADNAPGLPVISLGTIRGEFGIEPDRAQGGDAQGTVLRAALARAHDYLQAGRSFVWNATNLHSDRRAELVALFDSYRARVRIVYVEAPAERLFAENTERSAPVPERTIRSMMRRWQVPDLSEAHRVDYVV